MDINTMNEYELIEQRNIEELNSTGYLMKHKKSGARVMVLSNDDENKVFCIGFRTPAPDDTGVAHILEHSVLCGSTHFPAKDPFIELAKGSLNTFLNAMTYPDKTVYPVASCNDKDFQNLMHVYMDAVFNTNIYNREEIFRQEGWCYNLESEDAPLEYNGVVYNEMKGAFSSPEGVLDREIMHSLFPDTTYANESGGNPESIPDLKYSEFLGFHSRYYHPSNSYIYLYGNMDTVEKLSWLDREYLSRYDRLEIDSEIKLQKSFDQPVEVTKYYSIAAGESEENNTYLSYNTVIGTSLDKNLYLAFQILQYALISMPGAPLKKALIDAGIGKDVFGSYDNGILQPMFSIVSKNANVSQKDSFLSTIRSVLENIVRNGLDEKSLKAGINYFEFKYREADFGSYPKGLMYGLQAFDSWLYDEQEPFMHIQANDTISFLKSQIGTKYFENLIEQYMLNNTHASLLIVAPEKGLTTKMEAQVVQKLKAYQEGLDDYERDELVRKTKALELYQETPSTKEELEAIPLLAREDIKKEPEPLYITEKEEHGVKVLQHDLFTNGIGYLNLVFKADDIPAELIPYLGLMKSVLGYMDTEKYTYSELFNEINMNSGGIGTDMSLYPDASDKNQYIVTTEVKAKVLFDKLDFAFYMIDEILFTTKLEDSKRLYEIIAELKSRLQMNLNSSGHSAAALRSMSYFSDSAYLRNLTSGIGYYQFIEAIEKNYDAMKADVIHNLKRLLVYIFRPENLIVSYTANEEGYAYLPRLLEKFVPKLHNTPVEKYVRQFNLQKLNEGFKTSAQIQYVSRSGNFVDQGFRYTGALKVLKNIMNYDYLWNNIRVKGGAYGCMSNYTRSGDCYFVSYRDPNLAKTNEVYNGIVDYIKNFDADERDMTKFIIGTISEMDTPLNPSAKGARSLGAYLCKVSYEQLLQERTEVLTATKEDIRALADLIEAVLKQENICVIGNEDKIEQDKYLFDNIYHLFQD